MRALALKRTARVLAGLTVMLLLPALLLAVLGWNWARGPLQDLVLRKTGRLLQIDGDLRLAAAWPLPRVRAERVRLANPAWASAPQLLQADALEASIDLRELLRGRLALPEVTLLRPRLFLEQGVGADGQPRRTWLFDPAQSDDTARVDVGVVRLDRAEVQFLDPVQRTALQVALSTVDPGAAPARPLVFQAHGRFRGLDLQVAGSGGGVLAWRDGTRPYPLQVAGSIGATQLQAEGTVTSLLRWSAADLQLDLRGPDLALLYPLVGVALPPTPAYRVQGRLQRVGANWLLAPFRGQVGHSDVAGALQVATDGPRPLLTGALTSRRLDLADLGPAVGATPTPAAAPASARPVLPELPFDTARWGSLDADVTLAAATLLRPAALPLDRLQLRLRLQDRRLTLDPLDFSLAGGQLRAQVVLDGRSQPLRGQLGLQLRDVQLARLLPAVDLQRASIGRLQGDAALSGEGASVGRLLASADGRVRLVAQDGAISRLLMEQIGLHLLEILRLNLSGDETVALHCVVADFDVARGTMRPRVLVLDTAVSTVLGAGSISLADETLDLRFVPRTKVTSLVALRSPVFLRGPFRQPEVRLDSGQMVARGLGALALGLVNPLLALLPLFDGGPGADSPCAQLVQDARAPLETAATVQRRPPADAAASAPR
ncbi:AsmA family protein [Rubrivivax sp. RP6-9]|uniref:AsmA family protein n=1 Tax=Rubrivivax sp. RP6-9 TaxID=3415750 RepID=UPI003CC61BA3